MLPGASGKWRNCSSAPPGRHARMLSPVTATRRAPGRPRQHESGAHRGAISEGHRSMQPVCSVHFCSDAPPLLAWHRPLEGDQYDHDRAGVPRQRASMPVLGRVGERSGKQRSFLRPRRDLGERGRYPFAPPVRRQKDRKSATLHVLQRTARIFEAEFFLVPSQMPPLPDW